MHWQSIFGWSISEIDFRTHKIWLSEIASLTRRMGDRHLLCAWTEMAARQYVIVTAAIVIHMVAVKRPASGAVGLVLGSFVLASDRRVVICPTRHGLRNLFHSSQLSHFQVDI